MKRFVSMLCVMTTAATAQVTRVDRPYRGRVRCRRSVVVTTRQAPWRRCTEGRTIKTPAEALQHRRTQRAQLPAQSAALLPRQSPVTQPGPVNRQARALCRHRGQWWPFEFRVGAGGDIVVRRALTRWGCSCWMDVQTALGDLATTRSWPPKPASGEISGRSPLCWEATKLFDSGAVRALLLHQCRPAVVPVTERCDRSTD